MEQRTVNLVLLIAIFFIVTPAAQASGTDTSSWSAQAAPKTVSLYDQGVEANNKKDYAAALPLFEQALQQDPKNPDILNMLAHAQREVGKTDEAVANYRKALELRPEFPQAREYLGEAYVQAALKQIEILRGCGDKGKEPLEDLTQVIKDAAKELK